jgi:hypothetical protein
VVVHSESEADAMSDSFDKDFRENMRRMSKGRSSARITKRLKSLFAELKRRSPQLHDRLTEAANSGELYARTASKLIESLKDGEQGVCQNAAWALGKLADLGSQDDQRKALSALCEALESENTAAKVAFIEAVTKFKTQFPADVAVQLKRSLAVPDSSVVTTAVHGLAALGLTVVPDLVDDLTKLAQDGTSTDARVAACHALGELGQDASKALEALLLAVVGPAESRGKAKSGKDQIHQSTPSSERPQEEMKFQQAAIEAIVQIDTTGEYLVYEVQDAERREFILDLLRQVDAGSSATYQRLRTAWVEALSMGPPPNHQRMLKAEILTYIHAQIDDDRNLTNWMSERKLRAVRVKHGVYDVNIDDLETQRKLRLSRASGMDRAEDKSSPDQ